MFVTKYTQFDTFSVTGRWWLQGMSPTDGTDGILTVTAGESFRLKLFSRLKTPDEGKIERPELLSMLDNEAPSTIHGKTDDDKAVTLLHTFCAEHNTGSAGHDRYEYSASYVIVGNVWFDGRSDIAATSLGVRFTHLERWADFDPLKMTRQPDEWGNFEVAHKYPDRITATVTDPAMTVSVDPGVDINQQRNKSLNLTLNFIIKSEPATPFDFDTFLTVTNDLQRLFTMLVGEQVFIVKLGMNIAVEEKDRAHFPNGLACEVFVRQFEQKQRDDDFAHKMTLPRKALGNTFPALIQKWFESLATLRPVYDVFFGTYRTSRQYVQSQFLHLSQAIESFHRRVYGGQYLPTPEFEVIEAKMKAHILPSLPEGKLSDALTGLRDKLKSQIQYSNEPSLSKRLNALLDMLSAAERELICTNPGEFVGAIKDTRNYLTHLDETTGDLILKKPRDMADGADALDAFLTLLLLRHLGVPEDVRIAAVKRSHRLRNCTFELPPELREEAAAKAKARKEAKAKEKEQKRLPPPLPDHSDTQLPPGPI